MGRLVLQNADRLSALRTSNAFAFLMLLELDGLLAKRADENWVE